MSDYIFDLECNGFNPDKIYCVVVREAHTEEIIRYTDMDKAREFFASLTASEKLIGHNIVRFDVPIIERLLDIKVKAQIVDTLALSWYLFPKRNRHGLEQWGESFGIPKPPIADWDNLSVEEYVHRCTEDVNINTKLWDVMGAYLKELYVGEYEPLLEYLGFKMGVARLQEVSGWDFNLEKAEELHELLDSKEQVAKESLGAVMPQVKKYRKATRPAKPFKKDGTLSATGTKWKAITEEVDLPFEYEGIIEVFSHLEDPKPTSHQQVKDWLFTLGWKPTVYKYIKEEERDQRGQQKERKIPQIKGQDGNLCKSIERLIKSYPQLSHLKDLGVISHRKGLVRGLISDCSDDKVVAGIQGLTNTLRFIHKTCVNIPSLRKPYGQEVRSLFIAGEGLELCGSDMCSLEDRTKQHYMWKFDSGYVKDMMVDGFDPHLDIAVQAEMMTEEQSDAYKGGDKTAELDLIRYNAKTANYSSTYGAAPKTISRQAGISEKEAKVLHKAYWDRNWSLKAIADDCTTKMVRQQKWLYNPVSKLWYSLRADKDRFSTLNQGTGTYCFDMWVKELLKKPIKMNAQFHDEVVFTKRRFGRGFTENYLKECIGKVNSNLKLNRELDVDVQFGDSYADIH